jgi:hypothetical protein
LGLLPCTLTLWLVIASLGHHWVAQDFSRAYYPAAHRLLDGGNPYAVTHGQILSGAAFVYPALSAVLLAPLALVSIGFADHLYILLCIVLVPATLWVTGVRDWRVYGATMLWYPMIIGWLGENISVPLMFMTALVWRYRERPLVAGVFTAAAISMKPFLWPLGLWLLATRRWKAAACAFAWGIAFNLLAWALVGFNEISTYVHLEREDVRALWHGGYSLLALAHHLGLSHGSGYVFLALASAAVALAVLDRGLRLGDDHQTMVLAVGLMLVASPLVWIHYFVLLVVPLAIVRRRFSTLWVVPAGMWLLPPATRVSGWQFALAWVLVAGCLAAALRDAPVGGRRSAKRSLQTERPLSLIEKGLGRR